MIGKPGLELSRRRLYVLLGFLVCLVIVFIVWRNLASRASWQQYVSSHDGEAASAMLDGRLASRITAFCGDCHGMPMAENYPRDVWHQNVRQGYEYYARSGRNDLDPPPIYLTVAYFRSRAPEQVVFPQPKEAETELHVLFRTQHLALEKKTAVLPGIAHLRWTKLQQDGYPVLLGCDMKLGHVFAVDLRDSSPRPRILAWLNNPCHIEPCDLDGDGAIDLLVAELGSSRASDHHRGQVVWLRCRKAGDDYEKIVLASGLGRVADVQPADFDNDGDIDLIVAVFGLYETGQILLLRNTGKTRDQGIPRGASRGQAHFSASTSSTDDANTGRKMSQTPIREHPQFELETVDDRPGAIHVPVHDLNGDGRPDFLALVSQEYECVEAFINQGNAQFHLHTLWAAPDPTFGSTGIQLVDLDQDGDMDVLYTNGDTFDDQYVKPSHGVQWLDNLGLQQFAYRRLADLPGAYRALAGDIDLDGDMDIVAVSWLDDPIYPANAAATPMASIVYLEQTTPGTFARHTLEVGFPCHATLELADFDNDGDLDFAVGWQLSQKWRHLSHWLTIWWNQTRSETNGHRNF